MPGYKKSKNRSMMKKSKGGKIMKKSKGGRIAGAANQRRARQGAAVNR